ncbi:MAG TPA: zf-HC2 domain-containing protein [Terracidiphilus sp.]|jgi:anti-sigma factor RsiW
MLINKSSVHLNDEQLLGHLDGELAKSEARAVEQHLKRCWKCRTMLGDLQSQVKNVLRLLSTHSNSDSDRSANARQQFLKWKSKYEKLQKRSSRLWPPHLLMSAMGLLDIYRESEFALLPAS